MYLHSSPVVPGNVIQSRIYLEEIQLGLAVCMGNCTKMGGTTAFVDGLNAKSGISDF